MNRGRYYLLVLTFCLIFPLLSICQSLPVAADSLGGVWDIQNLLTEVFDSNTLQAISDAGILKEYSADVFDEYKGFFKSEDNVFLQLPKIKIPLPELYGSLESKFVKNPNAIEEADWVNLSYMKLGTAVNVFKLPLDISLQGAYLNKEFNWNLSSLNIQFDHREFLENIAAEQLNKAKAGLPENPLNTIKDKNLKDVFSTRLPDAKLPKNPFDNASIDLIKNELKYKVLAYVINHPKYQEIIVKGKKKKESLINKTSEKVNSRKDSLSNKVDQKLLQKKDGLMNSTDSLLQVAITKKDSLFTTYEKYKRETIRVDKIIKERDTKALQKELEVEFTENERYEQLLKISKDYKKTWETRKQYYGDSLNRVKDKYLNSISKDDLQKLGKDSLLSIVNSVKSNSLTQNILKHIQKLNIGQTVIDDHWFLAENLSLNGALINFEKGSYNISGAVGIQRFDYSILPLLGFSLPTQLPDKKFLYGSIVYKFGELFELKFSTLNSKEKFNDFSSGLPLERDNNVFMISGKTQILKGVNLITDVAYSRTQGLVVQLPDTDRLKDIDNAAGEIKLAYEIPNTGFEIEGGYFFIGSQYLSLGNPFLRKDQKGLTFGLSGSLFNRLNLNITARHGQSVASSKETPGRSDLTINVSASLNVTKNLTFTASVYPNFTNYQYNQIFKVASNLWSTSYDLQHSFQGEKVNAVNNLTYSNSINEFILQDSIGTSNYDGLIYYGQLVFNNGTGLDLLAMGWSEQNVFTNGFDQSNIQLNFLFQKKKLGLRTGLLLGKEVKSGLENSSQLSYGVSVASNILIAKKINIDVEARLPIHTDVRATSQVMQEYISTKMSIKL